MGFEVTRAEVEADPSRIYCAFPARGSDRETFEAYEFAAYAVLVTTYVMPKFLLAGRRLSEVRDLLGSAVRACDLDAEDQASWLRDRGRRFPAIAAYIGDNQRLAKAAGCRTEYQKACGPPPDLTGPGLALSVADLENDATSVVNAAPPPKAGTDFLEAYEYAAFSVFVTSFSPYYVYGAAGRLAEVRKFLGRGCGPLGLSAQNRAVWLADRGQRFPGIHKALTTRCFACLATDAVPAHVRGAVLQECVGGAQRSGTS